MKNNLFFRKREEESPGLYIKDPLTGENVSLYDGTEPKRPRESILTDDIQISEVPEDGDSIISEFYGKSDVYSDMSRSIFKMEEYMNTMPDSLPMDVKIKTVINVLITSGFIPVNLLNDGRERLDYIQTNCDNIVNSNNKKIEDLEDEISKLELEIDKHRQTILTAQKRIESVKNAVSKESKRIDTLMNYIMSTSPNITKEE